jgi:hypothetical protein
MENGKEILTRSKEVDHVKVREVFDIGGETRSGYE